MAAAIDGGGCSGACTVEAGNRLLVVCAALWLVLAGGVAYCRNKPSKMGRQHLWWLAGSLRGECFLGESMMEEELATVRRHCCQWQMGSGCWDFRKHRIRNNAMHVC